MTRIGTFATQQALIQRMLEVQKRVYDGQTQVGTEKKSQDYAGIATDSFRLINIENEKSRVDRFINNNTSAETNLNAMNTSVKTIDDRIRTLRQDLLGFTARDLRDQSTDDVSAVKDIQERAFAVLNDMEFFLNLKIDGKYLFGGGKSDDSPVTIPFDNVDEFQKVYDGIDVTYPRTRAAQLVSANFPSVNVSGYANGTFGTPPVASTQITADSGTFVTATVTDSSFGDITYDNNSAGLGQMTSTVQGAFSNFELGQTISLDNTSGNNGIYTVTAVSGDGRTLTLDQAVNGPVTDPQGTGTLIRFLPPNGTTLYLSGSQNGNDSAYTVRWPSNADIAASTYGSNLVDGSQIIVSGEVPNGTPETVSMATKPYYLGDKLELQHRVSETRTIKVGVNGLDPAFEKAIRAIGHLLQGDLMNNQERAVEALGLLNDAIEHVPSSGEEPGDLQDIQNRLGINQKVIADAKEDQKQFIAFLEVRQISVENIDPTEAAVKLNDDVRALNISFATLSKVQQLSLVNFL